MRHILALVLMAVASCLMPGMGRAQTFVGTGTGSIPDGGDWINGQPNYGAPLSVSFDVSGLSTAVAGLSLSITFNHGYMGDLEAILIPPAGSGADPFVIFSRVGQQINFGFNTSGSPATFGSDSFGTTPATYVFSDSATGNLWAAAGFDTATGTANFLDIHNLPAGSYRTSGAGPWDVAGHPNGGNENAGQFTSFANDSGFVGLTPAQANGTWILQLRDGAASDTGNVTASSLAFAPVPEPAHYALLAGLGLLAFAGYRRLCGPKPQ